MDFLRQLLGFELLLQLLSSGRVFFISAQFFLDLLKLFVEKIVLLGFFQFFSYLGVDLVLKFQDLGFSSQDRGQGFQTSLNIGNGQQFNFFFHYQRNISADNIYQLIRCPGFLNSGNDLCGYFSIECTITSELFS
ncbi:hypothetical protein ES708_30777 [subsurface metagenome]